MLKDANSATVSCNSQQSCRTGKEGRAYGLTDCIFFAHKCGLAKPTSTKLGIFFIMLRYFSLPGFKQTCAISIELYTLITH